MGNDWAGYEGGELLSLEEEISHLSKENRRLDTINTTTNNNNNNRMHTNHQDMSTEVINIRIIRCSKVTYVDLLLEKGYLFWSTSQFF